MKNVTKASLIFMMFLAGCAKHVPLTAPTEHITMSAENTWGYWVDGPSDWTIVSKVGPEKAAKFLCPKGYICTVEEVGIVYHLRRVR